MVTIDRVLQLVNESGLTAKEYALNAGLSAGNITDWKTGRSKPSVESLQKIAKYANVQLEWLTGDSEYKTVEEDFKAYTINQNKIVILKTLDRYHSEYIIPCSLKEKDVQFLLNTLSDVTPQNVKETKKQLNTYVNSFGPEKGKKVRKLINIILQELIDDMKYKNTFHYFASLIDKDDNKSNIDYSSLKFHMCPVYGKISAGLPNWAEECLEGYLPIDPNLMGIINPEECFFLRVDR